MFLSQDAQTLLLKQFLDGHFIVFPLLSPYLTYGIDLLFWCCLDITVLHIVVLVTSYRPGDLSLPFRLLLIFFFLLDVVSAVINFVLIV